MVRICPRGSSSRKLPENAGFGLSLKPLSGADCRLLKTGVQDSGSWVSLKLKLS